MFICKTEDLLSELCTFGYESFYVNEEIWNENYLPKILYGCDGKAICSYSPHNNGWIFLSITSRSNPEITTTTNTELTLFNKHHNHKFALDTLAHEGFPPKAINLQMYQETDTDLI